MKDESYGDHMLCSDTEEHAVPRPPASELGASFVPGKPKQPTHHVPPTPTTTYVTGPPAHFDLIYSDVWLPALYSRRILCFKLPPTSSHSKALKTLKRSLQSLVTGTPELGGQVVFIPAEERGGDVPWKAIRPGKGVELVVKDLTQEDFPSYDELERSGFPISAFKDEVLVPVPVAIQPLPIAEMVVQASLIEGGVLLCVCLGHGLTDGNGMNAVMVALGEGCRLAGEEDGEGDGVLESRVLKLDRTIMSELTGGKRELGEHPAYGYLEGAFVPKDVSKDVPATIDGEETKKGDEKTSNEAVVADAETTVHRDDASTQPAPAGVKTYTYHLSSTATLALKTAATTTSTLVSTHDAISALMWRTLMLARHKTGNLSPERTSTYTIPHNARRHVSLPPDWVGNCCYFISASVPVSQILAPGSLPLLASSIRAALNAVNSDVVGGLMELRKECTYSVTWWPLFVINEPEILMATSFYHSGLLGVDFGVGWGVVRHFTTSDEGAMGGFRNTCFVGPRKVGGGCFVSLGLTEGERGVFEEDELWREYVKEVEVGE